LIAVLFQRGAFDPADSAATAGALAAFATGLPAYVLIKVLAPAFFAREDTRTTVKVAAGCLAANVVLILLLIDGLGHVGIALATAGANWLNALALGTILWRRGELVPDGRLRRRLPRMLVAAAAMGLCVALLASWLGGDPDPLSLALLCATGLAVYLLAGQITGALDVRELAGELVPRRA